jgi:hypothetical protein
MAMTRTYRSVVSILGAVLCAPVVACSSNDTTTNTGSGGAPDSSTVNTGGGGNAGNNRGGGGGTLSDVIDAPNYAYTLIDDMEITTHGPIQFAGIAAPLSPGYWFNFGASVAGDNATPTIQSFTFSMLPNTTTVMGKASTKAAHQFCSLNDQYDVCGLGFEFSQVPLEDAGTSFEAGVSSADASLDAAGDAGDAGPPMVTVPFDISAYKGITFWGRADIETGTEDVKVQFPDTDTDPRGGVCNGPAAGVGNPSNTRRCFNSYAVHVNFTGEWQPFVVLFKDLAIDPTFGFMQPGPFTQANAEAGQTIGSKNVYGVNWQGQKNSIVDAGAVGIDFWVDDVYFIQ